MYLCMCHTHIHICSCIIFAHICSSVLFTHGDDYGHDGRKQSFTCTCAFAHAYCHLASSLLAFNASSTVQPELELELSCFGCPAAVSKSSYQSAPTHLSLIALYPFQTPDSPCQKSGTKTIFLLPSRDMFKAFHGSDIYVYTPIGHIHCHSYIAYPLPIDCHRCRYVSKASTTISYINIDM